MAQSENIPDNVPASEAGLTNRQAGGDETVVKTPGPEGADDFSVDVKRLAATESASQPSEDDPFAGVPRIINGRYTVRRFLGLGGYATVYEAYDEVLCRSVAIKIPRAERFDSKRTLDEFLTEARTAARLKHRSIVAVHDVDWTAEGMCFIVLDYLPGGTLSRALHRRQLELVQATELIADVAEAVAYANEQGLIHRDLKPSNILLDAEGRPHVTDFGLAAFAESPRLQTAEIVGTPAYMAPEQARGENHRLDGRTDLWSLGVIYYQLLTGRLPFTNASGSYFDEVLRLEPVPPRTCAPHVPREIERLCIRCLAKRMSERFASVAEFAGELRNWLARRNHASMSIDQSDTTESVAAASVPDMKTQSESTQLPERIIPKGLRAFGKQDANFFLQLLPGPRDRDGVPESIRFWKQVLESTSAETTPAICLLYGPSGCGKSSFLRAGLVPRLAGLAFTLYFETTPEDFEARVLSALRRHFPRLDPNLSLTETIYALRNGEFIPQGRKLVIVVDQFEQWLHAHRDDEDAELIRALRHCDGARLQCLLAVRDDFGMAATRFMGELEIPIAQGHNFATIDRFGAAHARKVLAEFGRAFGQLPDAEAQLTPAQRRFLDQAVSWLAEEGKVIPVRLALFAEMVKDRPWVPRTLERFGDTEGVGVAFLEEAFASRSANPNHVQHHQAARRILKALLPEQGTNIRGARIRGSALRELSGYQAEPRMFAEVLRILDSELRLVTPVEPSAPPSGEFPSPGSASSESSEMRKAPAGSQERFYQLAHDYLVPSIRAWLTRGQRETTRGRAELLLAEQAAAWRVRPGRRLLPSIWEWLRLLAVTRSRDWTAPERKMMIAATRHHALVLAVVAGVALGLAVAGVRIRSQLQQSARNTQARHLVKLLLTADDSQVPGILHELRGQEALTDRELRGVVGDVAQSDRARLHARLALLPSDPGQLDFLRDAALSGDPSRLSLVVESLKAYAADVVPACWAVATERNADAERRFRAACILAQLDPQGNGWPSIAESVASRLAAEQTLLAPKWAELLRPASAWLVPGLEKIFANRQASERARLLSAELLAGYLDQAPERLAELIHSADFEQFAALLPAIRKHREIAVGRMRGLMSQSSAEWPPDVAARTSWPAVPDDIHEALARGAGFATDRCALCQLLPLGDFDRIAKELTAAGYRPTCLRPHEVHGQTLLSASWVRDGQIWSWVHDELPEKIRQADRRERKRGLIPWDIAFSRGAVANLADPPRFSVLWSAPPAGVVDAGMYVGVPEEIHSDYWQRLNAGGFLPKTNLYVPTPNGGSLRSSIRWKLERACLYEDYWNIALEEFDRDDHDGCFQAGLHLAPSSSREPCISATWWDAPGWETRSVRAGNAVDHLKLCRQMADGGFRPVAVSVIDLPDGHGAAASLWERPVWSEAQREALARGQANAALTLLHLGEEAPVWPLFRQTPTPFVRSWLIHGAAPTGLDPQRLLSRLAVERDESSQQALMLALSRYGDSATRPQIDESITSIAADLWKTSPAPGVHSAAGFLLRSFHPDRELPELPADRWCDVPSDGRRWLVSPHGHTLAVLPEAIEFMMGGSANETHHESPAERLHRVRIPRAVAISTTEVTLEQFLKFQPDFEVSRDYLPERSCPMTNVTFYQALEYCRWLSEQEQIDEDQMCYPPRSQIRPGMTVPPDCLERTGYRLPTEAEWEYACRAGTRSSRPYGQSDELLPHYAWTFASSKSRAWPVARLLPNDFGLFDMLGNAMEYTQNAARDYERGPAGTAVEDLLDRDAFTGEQRVRRRGGAFLFQPADARSAHRDTSNEHEPQSRFVFLGFRIARTVKVAEEHR